MERMALTPRELELRFSNADPAFDASYILQMLQQMDPALYQEILSFEVEGEQVLLTDKASLLQYLYREDLYAFKTIERLQVMWQEQNAFMNALYSQMIEMFVNYRVVRNAYLHADKNMPEEVEKYEKKKKAQKKKKKDEESEKALAKAVKRVRFVETPQEVDAQGYLAKEPFSDAWDLTTYVHTPSTRRATKYVVKDLPGIVDLEEVYSVSGPWEGENLVDALAAKGKFAIVAKKKGGDQALAYKVFTGVLKQT